MLDITHYWVTMVFIKIFVICTPTILCFVFWSTQNIIFVSSLVQLWAEKEFNLDFHLGSEISN